MEPATTTRRRGAPRHPAPEGAWEVVDTSLHALLTTLVLAGTLVASAAAVNHVSERIGVLAVDPPAHVAATQQERS